jgi:hypothetical protein
MSVLLCTAAVRAIDEAGCDSITKRRVREVHELPGALWQIYDAHDADKIRDFLNKVRSLFISACVTAQLKKNEEQTHSNENNSSPLSLKTKSQN